MYNISYVSIKCVSIKQSHSGYGFGSMTYRNNFNHPAGTNPINYTVVLKYAFSEFLYVIFRNYPTRHRKIRKRFHYLHDFLRKYPPQRPSYDSHLFSLCFA